MVLVCSLRVPCGQSGRVFSIQGEGVGPLLSRGEIYVKKKVAVLVTVLATLALTASIAIGNDKVDVCHIPPGNPDNAHTINVSVNAVPAHLAHGDHVGSCEAPPPPQQ
jgi:hypothetical protein